MQPLEQPKDSILMFRGDPEAVIFNPKPYGIGSCFGEDSNFGNGLRIDEFQSVSDQIAENMPKRRRVPNYFVERRFDAYDRFALLNLALHLTDNVGQQRI